LSLLLDLCTRIGVLYAGRLVESAAARTLTYKPAHPYTDALLRCFPGLQGPPGPLPRLTGIGGAPPDPRDPPPGCRFHPRCASCVDVSSTTPPALTTVAADHEVACHRLRS